MSCSRAGQVVCSTRQLATGFEDLCNDRLGQRLAFSLQDEAGSNLWMCSFISLPCCFCGCFAARDVDYTVDEMLFPASLYL